MIGGVPNFPEEPGWGKAFKIFLRYGEKTIKHLADSTSIVGGIIRLLAREDGRKLISRLTEALLDTLMIRKSSTCARHESSSIPSYEPTLKSTFSSFRSIFSGQ